MLTQEYEHARFDLCVLLGRLARRPVFATFQGGIEPHSRLERPIRPFTIRACAGVVIASGVERERVRRAYRLPPDRIAAIPNAIDVAGYQPTERSTARRLLGIGDATRVAEWHGRVEVHRKGLDVLLDAWAILCNQRPLEELLLLLVGTGRDAAELRRRIDALGLDSIRWRDEYVSDRAELSLYLSAADVYVLASRHEGFPVAPIEAMAAGLPVVCTDAPGVADILDGELSGGIVVPREDPRALAETLGGLLEDGQRRTEMALRARKRAADRYSLESVGAQLRDCFFPVSTHGRTSPDQRFRGFP